MAKFFDAKKESRPKFGAANEGMIESPKVESLTISVNVIRIGNKQMTLSVFNQIFEENPFDENNNIIYNIWGKINYGKKDYETSRIWVIFQKGDGLRKYGLPNKIYPYISYEQALNKEVEKFTKTSYFYPELHDFSHLTLRKEPVSAELIKIVKEIIFDKKNGLTTEEKFNRDYYNYVYKEQNYINSIKTLHAARQLFIAV